MLAFRRLLVPVSFEETALESVRVAAELAERDGGEVHLLHVVPSSQIGFPQQPYHLDDGPGEGELAIETAAKAKLARIAATHGGDRASFRMHARIGAVAERILEAAVELGSDLIVMPTHGRRGVAHLALGSVTEEVVRRATCPVLTIRGGREPKRSSAG